jgi:hypothetical protein
VEGGHAEPVGGVGCAEKGAHGAREEAAIAGTGVGAGGFAAASEGMRSVLQDSRCAPALLALLSMLLFRAAFPQYEPSFNCSRDVWVIHLWRVRAGVNDGREGSGGIVWGPPSSEEAVMFEPRTDTMSGTCSFSKKL